MSPLLAAPNRGYADWQRTENYDSGALWTENEAFSANSIIMDVSRYAYLGGVEQVQGLTTDAYWARYWWQASGDPGGTLIAFRDIVFDAHIGQAPVPRAQMRIPNLGPFCQIFYSAISAAPNHFAWYMGTNRYSPLEFTPQEPLLINEQGVNVDPSVPTDFYPNDYYSGPLSVWVEGLNPGTLNMMQEDTTGAWNFMNQFDIGSTDVVVSMIAPVGAWRLRLQNTGGVSDPNVFLTATPALTGSS